jgi:heterodisulfide reductase subunit D
LHRNPAGLPSEDRILWIEEKVNKHPYEDNPILFWPGCTTSYRLPELVEDTCEILNTAGYDFGLLGESEGCCGLIMYLSGHWDEAKSNAEKRLEQLGDISRLVTNCSGCYYCFSKVYPRLGLTVPFEVVHTSHIIKESIKEDRLKLNEYKGTYIWHDPCDLGRHSQVYEPPRYVLNSIPGLKLLESSLNREHTICCGAGGGLWMYNEELTNHVSWIKITKTVPEKIDGIITGCPTCLISIRNTVREITPNLRVFDIVEVVKNSI